jgi:hypothetical protein
MMTSTTTAPDDVADGTTAAGPAYPTGSDGAVRPVRHGAPSRGRRALGALGRSWRADDGAATAEYAIVIMAAVGFAGLLVVIMRSDEVRGVLSDLVRSALTVG